jgi:hypothetical protein
MRHNFGVFTSCEAAIYNVSLQISVGDRQQLWDDDDCWDDDNRAGDKSVGKCSVALLCLWVARSKYKYLQTLILSPLRMKEPQRRADHSCPFTFCGDREGLEFSFMTSYVFYCMSLRQVDKFSFCVQDHVVGCRFSDVSGTTMLIELNTN